MERNIPDIPQEPTIQPSQEEVELCMMAMRRNEASVPDIEQEWEKMSRQLDIAPESQPLGSHIYKLLGWAASIAAAVLLIWVWYPGHDQRQQTDTAAQQQVAGTARSYGSLSQNGSKAKPERAASSGTVPPPSTGTQITLTTKTGEDLHATLPDGTQVWLNADSKLRYPRTFAQDCRKVSLSGEAYFEVTKDSKRQFEVITPYFTTKVLGTTFNLCAYSDKEANIVLIEGRVLVGKGEQEVRMKPGERVSWNMGHGFELADVDTYPYVQWKNGFFYFENQSLFKIMQTLGKWYNVNVVFDDPQKMNLKLHYVANRKKPLKEAIANLNETGLVQVEIEKHALVVK